MISRQSFFDNADFMYLLEPENNLGEVETSFVLIVDVYYIIHFKKIFSINSLIIDLLLLSLKLLHITSFV